MPVKKLKRSVTISGHRTSVSLEAEFWQALTEIAAELKRPLAKLIDEIDKRDGRGNNLSSALRVFVLAHYRKKQ
ncbi:MAG: ribbon-helix-helix domain-containing protein [Alphaproteobacteria bacterium]|nr:ribbon-helix-helix domain-containing protein [Alphaproteobacteria bacterium]